MGVIEVDGLTKDYGHGRGVFNVSFEVSRGEVFGFLGPNGAGKSTTIRHIMGFSKPERGQTRVFGLESFSCYHEILKSVGYLPGEIALPEGLTGWEFIKMMGSLRKSENKERLEMLLKRFELDPSGETKRMSLGDKRKLAIVTAFMDDPEVLVLDEPTSGLDPVMQQEFINFIKEEKERGKTILLSSHIFSEVDATCDRIAIIKDGVIVSTFEANDIKHNENKIYELIFGDEASYDKFIKGLTRIKKDKKQFSSLAIKEVCKRELKVVVAVNDLHINELTTRLDKLNLTSFKEIKFTLEDYFMQFYKEDRKFGGEM